MRATNVGMYVCAGIVAGLMTSVAHATVGPPIKITMPPDTAMAQVDQVYDGVWELHLKQAGVIDSFELAGDKWQILALDRSLEGQLLPAGMYTVSFSALPTTGFKPLTFSLKFDGRPASRRLRLGDGGLVGIAIDEESTNVVQLKAGSTADEPGQTGMRFKGRIMYNRPGRIDPNTAEPIFFGATDEPLDHIRVRVMDEEIGFDEELWAGYTDPNGYFDSGGYVSISGDDPDIYLQWECDTDIVRVQDDESILEEEFEWYTQDVYLIPDFTGTFVDFGTWRSGNTEYMAPQHIHNSIVKAYRFIMDSSKTGVVITGLPQVDVLWPDPGNNAYYDGEIHISRYREWQEGTHTHEYGHHLLDNAAQNVNTDYCQGLNFCDGIARCTSGTNCEDPGHCMWCPETDHDAWNEGFPNWLADIITRDYPVSYEFSDGSPYKAFYPRPLERIDTCCQDGGTYDPFITEGYIGALLRDIEDGVDPNGFSLQDNEDGDIYFDCLALGYDEIFKIALIDDVITPAEFINTFISKYPEHIPALYSTAYNVHPSYVSNFPTDTQPPGAVPYVTSYTHPPIVGGESPCIELELGPVPDDVTGACAYSTVWSTFPGGVEPDMDPNVDGTCFIVSPPRDLGDHWISIRARDCADHWSSEWAVFGPFTVSECNGNEILDICEIPCYDVPGDPNDPNCQGTCDASILATDTNRNVRLSCVPPPDFCSTRYPGMCGMGRDCNRNLVPDDCDIANGTSADCNLDGIPDECQNMWTWIGGNGSWHDPNNWDRGTVPPFDCLVCIDDPNADITVSYTQNTLRLKSLSCHDNLNMNSSLTYSFELDNPSFIKGDLTIGGRGSNTFRNNDYLIVSGKLIVKPVNGDYWLRGSGTWYLNGGAQVDGRVLLWDGKDLFLDNNSASTATSYITLYSSGTSIRLMSGSTYEYSGSSNIFYGTNGLFYNAGTFKRVSGTGNATMLCPVNNDGLIQNQTGSLSLGWGGTSTGDLIGDPGTTLSLSRDHTFTDTSTLVADDLQLLGTSSGGSIGGAVNISGDLDIIGGDWTFENTASVTSYGQTVTVVGTGRFEAQALGVGPDMQSLAVGEGSSGGTAWFTTGQTFEIGSLNLHKGNIQGSDPLTLLDSFTWGPVGQMFAGGAVTCECPFTVVATSSARYLYRQFYNTDHATFLGSIGPSGSGAFNNLPTGTADFQGNVGISSGTVNNEGLIVKSAGTGVSTLATYLFNSGTIHAQIGTLSMGYSTGENSGEIIGDPNTLLNFVGAHEMLVGSSLTADEVEFNSSTTNIRGDVNISGMIKQNGGTTTFTNEANVTSYSPNVFARNGAIHFEAPVPEPTLDFETFTIGEASYGCSVYFDTGQSVHIGTLPINRGSLNGADPVTIHDSFTFGGVASLFNGGDVTCLGDSTFVYTTSGRYIYRDFYNAGHANMLGSFTLSNADFINTPDGTLEYTTDGPGFSLSSSGTLYNNGLLLKSAGTGINKIHCHFRNAGTVDVQTGQFELLNDYGITTIQTAGQTILDSGGLNLPGSTNYQIEGGELTGIGLADGVVTNIGGVVAPGTSPGILSIGSTYTHDPNAVLDIELGGLIAGSEYDQLAITGIATLNGGLVHVVPTNGFIPQVGQQFLILTAASVQGTFSAVTGPGEYSLTHNPTDVTLTVVTSPICGDIVLGDYDEDCDIGFSDFESYSGCNQGPDIGVSLSCQNGDYDAEGDIDLFDLYGLQQCFSGEGVLVDPNCGP